MAVKYRNMQQHPRQGSYIRQALTHSVLQTRENMTIKIEEKKNLHKENLEKIWFKERHLVAIQCTSSTTKNTNTHFALRIDMYQEQGVGLKGISTNLLISHVPTHALGTFHNHYQWSSSPIIMVSHSQFFRSKTQDQNSSDNQDQNSLETQYQNSITKYQKNYFSKKKVYQVGKLSLRRLAKRRHTVEPRRTSIGKPMPHLPPHDFTAVKSRCASSDMLPCVTAPSLRQLSQCPAS